jgi:peroxiredoxin
VGYNSGVGREAPTFTLTASDGSQIALEEYRRDWFPVLVFLSTAGAGAALAPLSEAADALWGLRGQLVGICVADASEVGDIAARGGGATFPLLADDGTVARAYGACRPDGQVRPMAFIIDRAGKIVWSAEGIQALEPATILTAFRQVVR